MLAALLALAWISPPLSGSDGLHACRRNRLHVVKLDEDRAGAVFFYTEEEGVRLLTHVAYDDAMTGKWAACRAALFALQPWCYACFGEDDVRAFYSEAVA